MGRVFITGATGLIGRSVVEELLKNGYEVVALVRDLEKATRVFGEKIGLSFVKGDVSMPPNVEGKIDYIIHAASQTASKAFIEEPVEVSKTAIFGTVNLLEFARIKKVKGFVYLSSMEVYGSPATDEKIDEECGTNLNTMKTRTSYPESKRMCESLCRSYWSEYGVPTKVVRLTQTFGKGVSYNDKRVFAEFARCHIEGRDIVLHTRGETKRNYLSITDAVSAIIKVMIDGVSGEAYNAANEETYCSIYEMAQLVAENKISVIIDEDEIDRGYAPVLHMNLDTTKLRGLGWNAKVGLKEMYAELIESMKNSRD